MLRLKLICIEKNFVTHLESKKAGDNIKKHEVKKKLRKALKYTQKLRQNFGKYMTNKDQFELEVLENIISGTYHIEKRQFKEAKENLLEIIKIVSQLQKGVSLIEQTHLQEIIDGSKQKLRLCKFQLRELDEGEEELLIGVEDREEIQKILELQNQNIEKKTLKLLENKTIDIEDKDLIKGLNKIELLRKSFENGRGFEGAEELFWELMEAFDESIKKAKKNINEAGNNLELSSIWGRVESLLRMQKQMYKLRRNIKVYASYQKKNPEQVSFGVSKKGK